jgi:hypothetical protein
MAEEWRVSLVFTDCSDPGKRNTVRDLLRRRLGDEISVSGDKTRLFLYTGTEDAAEQAEYAARDVLAQQGLAADFCFECWDPAGQAWRDPRADPLDGTGPEDEERPGRLRSAARAVLPTSTSYPPCRTITSGR